MRGSLPSAPGHLIDLMATCVDLADAPYPKSVDGQAISPMEGKSLAPVLRSGERQGHDALYWEHEGNRAVRRGDWKLVSRFPGPWELYNLADDRSELTNLAETHPDLVASLSTIYEAWATRSSVIPWSVLPRPDR
jgi:arylsulfatase